MSKLSQDKNAALEGLPLYLVILVIIAAVGIATVLTWMAPLKSGLGANIGSIALTENGGVDKITCSTQLDGTAKGSGNIVVTVKDQNNKPLVGADVELRGCGVVEAEKTDSNGVANFGTVTACLQPNVDVSYIQVTVKVANSEKTTTIIVKRA
ncbi:MAG: hypothetical protein QME47_00880 [Candidatus Thermoplasmatota archaeon]|nr:hypothetical protein [Candidatus Thermoplasmatota archaeon]